MIRFFTSGYSRGNSQQLLPPSDPMLPIGCSAPDRVDVRPHFRSREAASSSFESSPILLFYSHSHSIFSFFIISSNDRKATNCEQERRLTSSEGTEGEAGRHGRFYKKSNRNKVRERGSISRCCRLDEPGAERYRPLRKDGRVSSERVLIGGDHLRQTTSASLHGHVVGKQGGGKDRKYRLCPIVAQGLVWIRAPALQVMLIHRHRLLCTRHTPTRGAVAIGRALVHPPIMRLS